MNQLMTALAEFSPWTSLKARALSTLFHLSLVCGSVISGWEVQAVYGATETIGTRLDSSHSHGGSWS